MLTLAQFVLHHIDSDGGLLQQAMLDAGYDLQQAVAPMVGSQLYEPLADDDVPIDVTATKGWVALLYDEDRVYYLYDGKPVMVECISRGWAGLIIANYGRGHVVRDRHNDWQACWVHEPNPSVQVCWPPEYDKLAIVDYIDYTK